MVFTITLSAVSGLPVTVSFATSDGTAHAPDDYLATTGSVTIPAGSTSTTFSVLVVGDTLHENNETFSFVLSDPVNATLGTATATGTIIDNDPPPVVSISDSSLTEGNSGTSPMSFTVSLSTASGLPVTATYTTTNGSAKAPGDYTTSTGTVTIPALSTSATFTVPIVGDTIYEGNEAFTVTLSAPNNATLGTATATGTIIDNDPPPVVSIADSSVAEGNSGTGPMVFTVTLSAASGLATSVHYQTANGSAIAPGDYTAGSGTVTIPAGSTIATFSVLVVGDTLYEGDETFTVALSAPNNATLGDATATGRIDDDEVAPVLSVANVAVSEGASGTTPMVFTVTASKVAGVAMRVDYDTANGTAFAPGDYMAKSGTVTIPAGSTSATFAVLVDGDTLYEANETFGVTLSAPVNATIGVGTATGTINNDDTAPSVSVSDVSVSEGNSGTTPVTFTVIVNAVSGLPATVNYATSNGSASAPGDYTAKSGSVTIPAGSTSATFTVNVVGDNLYEGDETFTVTLSGPVNATLGTASTTATIENDDAPPAVSVANAFRTEGDTGTSAMVFTVSLDAVSGLPVTVSYATHDGSATAPADYTAKTGSVTIPIGQTSATFTVLVVGDHVHEGVESFDVVLSNPVNAVLGDAIATGTITDDDDAGVSIDDLSVTEGDAGTTPAVFHVSLSSPSVDDVTVDYATNGGSATAPSDYISKTGSVTVPAGDTEATFTVLIVGDTLHEPDETFTVSISNPPAGVNIVRAVATATIIDDDAAPVVSIGDVSVSEGDAGTTAAEFAVSLNRPSATATTVSYATSEGSATPPGDYHTKTGTLTIPAGATSASITVDVVGDTLHEHDETFTVSLSDPTGATLGDDTATGTIVDDDAAPTVSIADISVQEHDSATTAATFTVMATAVSGTPTTVTYATSDGSAHAPGDYIAKTGTVAIAAGQTTGTFTVAVVGDTLFEPDETFTVTLSNPVDATLGDYQATATIVDDDTAPTVSIAGTSGAQRCGRDDRAGRLRRDAERRERRAGDRSLRDRRRHRDRARELRRRLGDADDPRGRPHRHDLGHHQRRHAARGQPHLHRHDLQPDGRDARHSHHRDRLDGRRAPARARDGSAALEQDARRAGGRAGRPRDHGRPMAPYDALLARRADDQLDHVRLVEARLHRGARQRASHLGHLAGDRRAVLGRSRFVARCDPGLPARPVPVRDVRRTGGDPLPPAGGQELRARQLTEPEEQRQRPERAVLQVAAVPDLRGGEGGVDRHDRAHGWAGWHP